MTKLKSYEDENDTLRHLMAKPMTTTEDRIKAATAIYAITISASYNIN